MNEESAKKVFKQKGIVNIPNFKKVWYSITKFEKYPEMATEGVGRAFGYLLFLVFMFSIIFSIGLLIKFHLITKEGLLYIESSVSKIEYSNGELRIDTPNENVTTNFGNLVINTKDISDEQVKQYENRSSFAKVEVIWLKNKVIFKAGEGIANIYYKDVLDNFDIKSFDKNTIVSYLRNLLNSPKVYIAYGIFMIISLCLAYFFATLIDILMLSLFGMVTTFFAKIQIRYRAIFNMSVYAITLSTVLRLIYYLIRVFTNFEVKYFDMMYTAISFICLVAAIFMIKSDVIKQQIELMKIIEKNKQIKDEIKEDKEDKEKEEDNKEKDNKEEEKKNEKEEKNPKGDIDPNVEGQVNLIERGNLYNEK